MSKLVFLDSLKEPNFDELGLKCGLEIHQQLQTGKLFSKAPCKIVPNETLTKEIKRKLRFSNSETGEVDKAALAEFKKGKFNIYKYNNEIATLVDLDEEPPVGPNKEAFKTAIQVSQMLNLKFFDKLQFMRKLIVDGSVTGGFQRTAMLGLGGTLTTSFGEVEIHGVNLEEDSCRVLERNHDHTIFALDRQGIPLIEITTGPQIHTPSQAQEAAKQIGNILRSFSQTKRGLGTIRQDLNVSIIGGARVEIKGAQNLKLMPKIVENEVKRQVVLNSISQELKARQITPKNFSCRTIFDVTQVFETSESKVIKSNLEGKNTGVFAIALKGFDGILGHEIQENYRFATEVSTRNKQHFPKIKGLFHSDELPKYGIKQEDVVAIRKELSLDKQDAFILIAQEKTMAKESLKNVLDIISELMIGPQEEVRQVDPKGVETNFLRPMPGSARMYPETDIPEIELTKEQLQEFYSKLPELYNKKLQRLSSLWGCEESVVVELLEKYTEKELTSLLKRTKVQTLVTLLFDLPKDIKKRDKIEPKHLNSSLLETLLTIISKKNLNQSMQREILVYIYSNPIEEANLEKVLEQEGLLGLDISQDELKDKVKEIVEKNPGAPFGALMGQCMKAFQGKVDGKIISQYLKKLQ